MALPNLNQLPKLDDLIKAEEEEMIELDDDDFSFSPIDDKDIEDEESSLPPLDSYTNTYKEPVYEQENYQEQEEVDYGFGDNYGDSHNAEVEEDAEETEEDYPTKQRKGFKPPKKLFSAIIIVGIILLILTLSFKLIGKGKEIPKENLDQGSIDYVFDKDNNITFNIKADFDGPAVVQLLFRKGEELILCDIAETDFKSGEVKEIQGDCYGTFDSNEELKLTESTIIKK